MPANWVEQTTTTTGPGDLTLNTVASNRVAFSVRFAIGQPFPYLIKNSSGDPVECGWGYLSATNTLKRPASVIEKLVGGTLTVGGTPVSLAADTYTVEVANLAQLGCGGALPGIHALASVRGMIPFPYIGSANGKTLTADTPIFICGRYDLGKPLATLGVYVNTVAGTTTDKVRVGVYGINQDDSIGSLICQSGDMRTDSTGMKTSAATGGALSPGAWYYWVMLASCAVKLEAAQGGNSTIAAVTPMGMKDMTFANSFGTANAITSGWSTMPTTITAASLTSMGTDYAPLPFYYP